jgi:threonine-phosphate decarboxylase
MTKFYGAAGVRMGTLIARPDRIAALRRSEPLWKLSALDSAYIEAAVSDEGFAARSERAHRESKAYTTQFLTASPLVKRIYPSEANYLLIELADLNAEAFQERLLPYRILVRSCANFDGLDDRHVRIAIKSLESMRSLAEALDG